MNTDRAAPALTDPITSLPRVTQAQASSFARMGVRAVAHLVDHLPHRYELVRAGSAIQDLAEGETASVTGELTAVRVARGFKGKGRIEAVLHDGESPLSLVFFNQMYLQNKLLPGMRITVQGKVSRKNHTLTMTNPKWSEARSEPADSTLDEDRLEPVYPATEDLPPHTVARIVRAGLPYVLPRIADHLSDEYRAERALPLLQDAYRYMHSPVDEDEPLKGTRRLAYDELLFFQLAIQLKRAEERATLKAPALRHDESVDERIRARIPFTLTASQDEVIRELVQDLTTDTPANRLIQGDVGSGKTVVALYAMLLAVVSEAQAAMLAPTEILAEQHHASLSRMLDGSSVTIGLITGSMPAQDRDAVLGQLAAGTIDIIVGTHALLTESVRFEKLAVAVVDEQHRFGVHQRAALRGKSGAPNTMPHTLVMTATPIPRTLAMTIFGDLEVSTIKHRPAGRTPVKAVHVLEEDAPRATQIVEERLSQDEQAFWVVPAIDRDPAGSSSLRSVQATVDHLRMRALPNRSIEALHGRMNRVERDRVMRKFRRGEIDVLVSTTVIEVGVDVPNATVIVIDHADRFGLAQLHQLRGRVGRGDKPGTCVLVATPSTEDGHARIEALVQSTDGFVLAEKDLEIRGPGEFLGLKQSGLPPFKVADLTRHIDLLNMARRDAKATLSSDPTLSTPEHALVRTRLLKRIGSDLTLSTIA